MPTTQSLELIVNGEVRRFDVAPDASLLEVLRDHCGLISPKNGCSPQGQCGCCTVIVGDNGNAKAMISCAVPAAKVAGKNVCTLEGLSELERDVFARSCRIRRTPRLLHPGHCHAGQPPAGQAVGAFPR